MQNKQHLLNDIYKITENLTATLRLFRLSLFVAPLVAILLAKPVLAQVCPYDPSCVDNPYGAGSPYNPNSINNPYGPYGSPYSNKSVNNPYATDAPKLYDSEGKYLGRLSSNPYDPDSTSNPYGRYGSPFSPDSINNPFGAGNPFNPNPVYVVPQ